jgi:hypothetical protein
MFDEVARPVGVLTCWQVMSLLQKSVRRGLVDDAMYWASELDRSGRGKSAIERLTVICSEDVSLGVVEIPIYLSDQYHKWLLVHNSPGNQFATLTQFKFREGESDSPQLCSCACKCSQVSSRKPCLCIISWIYSRKD